MPSTTLALAIALSLANPSTTLALAIALSLANANVI